MQQAHTPQAACFGEILWDLFPGKNKTAGGAPFNVGYHLHKMGVKVHAISAIGKDDLGNELIAQLDKWGMRHHGIQRHADYPTSTVVATIDEDNEAHYEIKEGVAWDYISLLEDDKKQLQDVQALVFGSLAARNAVSRETLYALLDESNYRVFDVNIRPPFCEKEVVLHLLKRAELAKFNFAELTLVLDFLGKSYENEYDGMAFLQEYFQIPEIILSRGASGATYVHEGIAITLPAAKVIVNDTVGSGDSFLAGFLSARLAGLPADEALEQAICLSGYVTTQSGACPDYTLQEIEQMKQSYRETIADRRV